MIGAIGQIVYVRLAARVPPGHEQEGARPAVVVGDPANVGPPRFGMVLVVPLTTFRGQSWQAASPALYPVLPAGAGGIAVDSIALLDQTQAVDATRVGSLVGLLTMADFTPIEAGLRQLCDL